MARFRRRSVRGYGGHKRNVERRVRAGTSQILLGQQQTAYTYTAEQACVVKSIKMDLGIGDTEEATIAYALVHVREGYDANLLVYPAITDDMYNPTMDVLISGVLTDSAIEDHKSNMIGRKLKKGDRLCLCVAAVAGSSGLAVVKFEMNFSVMT